MQSWKYHWCVFLFKNFLPQEKCKYILGPKEHPPQIYSPRYCRIFSSYPHVYLGNKSFFINIKGTTEQPWKMKYIYNVLQEQVQFPIWIQLVCWYWLPRIRHEKNNLNSLCRLTLFWPNIFWSRLLSCTGSALMELNFICILGDRLISL